MSKLEDLFDSDDVVIVDEKTNKKSIQTIYKPKYKDNSKKKIFSPLRNRYLDALPEEIVRQEFICKLIFVFLKYFIHHNHPSMTFSMIRDTLTTPFSLLATSTPSSPYLNWIIFPEASLIVSSYSALKSCKAFASLR